MAVIWLVLAGINLWLAVNVDGTLGRITTAFVAGYTFSLFVKEVMDD